MTSGQFRFFPIEEITVDRATRQRRQLEGIPELAASIAARGQIQPIVITRDGTLIAGERRLEAVKSLGYDHILVHFTDELDPQVLRLIELEENIKRVDLSWQDYTKALAEFHAASCEIDPTWTAIDTAKALNFSEQGVSRNLLVARELSNPKIFEAAAFSVAFGMVSRDREREGANIVAALRHQPHTELLPGQQTSSSLDNPQPLKRQSPIQQADFRQWGPTFVGQPFNFIHCDFPYGIGADNFEQGNARAAHGEYADTKEVYFQLLNSFADNYQRFMDPSSHLMFWFSMTYYRETLDFFAKRTDIVINPFPLVWMKSDNVGLLPDPARGPRRIYETALIGSRGDRKVVTPVANAFAHPTVRDRHMSEKPQAMLAHFFRMFVDQHSRVLDPTCGSGSAIRAALAADAIEALGLELDAEFVERARIALELADVPSQ